MKNGVHFLVLLLTTSLMFGCSKDSPTEEPVPVPEPEKKELIFKTGDKTHLWPGDVREIDILTEGTYKISPLNNQIATVEPISNRKFKITAKAKGVTQTSIIDENEDIHTFNIWVNDESPSGEWTDITDRFKVVISVSNTDTKTKIESDLGNKRINWLGATYNFNAQKNTFKAYSSTDYSGTYSFDIYSKKFMLSYDGNNDLFSIKTDPAYGETLTLIEDLTDYYKEQYPDGGIQEISTSRTITRKRLEFE